MRVFNVTAKIITEKESIDKYWQEIRQQQTLF